MSRGCLVCNTRARVESFLKLRGIDPPEGFRVEWEDGQYAVYSTRDGFKMGTARHKKDVAIFWDRPSHKNGYYLESLSSKDSKVLDRGVEE